MPLDPVSDDALEQLTASEMRRGDLESAAEHAALIAARSIERRGRACTVTLAKLEHDVAQMELLRERGVLGSEIAAIVADYRRAMEALAARGPDARLPLGAVEFDRIRDHYNRPRYVRPAAKLSRALSGAWDPAWVERQYLEVADGLVVVDDFLARDALDSLWLFCQESMIWSENRYAYGRLGAFFETGFHCPLLVQIAQDLRRALPRVIGERYTLRQMWAFKYPAVLEADRSTHADFAAVSVNFWITPDCANLDPESGGLVMYNVRAPADWGFERYQNTDWETLAPFLRERDARAIRIPYRQNRAVIFDSDRFHGTDRLRFRPGYEHRRINVTMLYGDREDDLHYPLQASAPGQAAPELPAWRSAAFASVRRRR